MSPKETNTSKKRVRPTEYTSDIDIAQSACTKEKGKLKYSGHQSEEEFLKETPIKSSRKSKAKKSKKSIAEALIEIIRQYDKFGESDDSEEEEKDDVGVETKMEKEKTTEESNDEAISKRKKNATMAKITRKSESVGDSSKKGEKEATKGVLVRYQSVREARRKGKATKPPQEPSSLILNQIKHPLISVAEASLQASQTLLFNAIEELGNTIEEVRLQAEINHAAVMKKLADY